MITKTGALPEQLRENMRGGDGIVQISHAAAADMLPAGVRLHARLTLPAGASIGEHRHERETELFYVLQGKGEMLDHGVWTSLAPGDAASTGGGASHALRNTGEEPFVLMATIVKEC